MRPLLLLLPCVILMGCSSPRVPEALVRPPKAEIVDVSPVRRSTDTTAKEVLEAQREADSLKGELQEARNRARMASELADEALAEGLERGSKEALRLSQTTRALQNDLEASQKKVTVLSDTLTKAQRAAEEAQEDVRKLEVAAALVDIELQAYKSLFDAANERIEEAHLFEESMNKENAKLEAQRDLSRVWTRRWAFGTIGLAAIIGIYIYLRFQRLPWIR
jgi:chromosome segregation ATPase